MKAVILCGGKGTRLRPLTETTPKPLVEVAGRPCLDYIIQHLKDHGFKEIILSLLYKPEAFYEYSTKHNLVLDIQTKDLDTAGALKRMESILTDPFIVMNGDTISTVDLNEMLKVFWESASEATVFSPNPRDIRHNGGAYIFAKSVLKLIPKNKKFSLHNDLLPKIPIIDVFTEGYYHDIGTLEKLQKAIGALNER